MSEIHPTRAKMLAQFAVNAKGGIQTPGPYNGENIYIPYYAEIAKDGAADQELADGVYICKVTHDEKLAFPEIDGATEVTLQIKPSHTQEIFTEEVDHT